MSLASPVTNIIDCSCAVEAIDVLGVRTCGVGGGGAARCWEVAPAELPEPFRGLLAHAGHVSEAVNSYYRSPVELHVMSGGRGDDEYVRKTFLTLQGKDAIIGYGLIHVRLQHLPDEVAKPIRQAVHPVGQILTRHKVDHRVEPKWYVRLDRGSGYLRSFGTRLPGPAFGRVGMVYCRDKPAVQFLDIVTGIDPARA